MSNLAATAMAALLSEVSKIEIDRNPALAEAVAGVAQGVEAVFDGVDRVGGMLEDIGNAIGGVVASEDVGRGQE